MNVWDCECSEDEGPCEVHGIVLAQREGAAVRTADELMAVFIDDCVEIRKAEGIQPYNAAAWDAEAVAALYWSACPDGGWLPESDDEDAIDCDVLADACRDMESALPAGVWVYWNDGYSITRITGGPLFDDSEAEPESPWFTASGEYRDGSRAEAFDREHSLGAFKPGPFDGWVALAEAVQSYVYHHAVAEYAGISWDAQHRFAGSGYGLVLPDGTVSVERWVTLVSAQIALRNSEPVTYPSVRIPTQHPASLPVNSEAIEAEHARWVEGLDD